MKKISLTTGQKSSFNYLIAILASFVPCIALFIYRVALDGMVPAYLNNIIPWTLLILYISSIFLGVFYKIKGLIFSFIFQIIFLIMLGWLNIFFIFFIYLFALLFIIPQVINVQRILYALSKQKMLALNKLILINNVILSLNILFLPTINVLTRVIEIDVSFDIYIVCALFFISAIVLLSYLCYLLKKSE